MTQFSEEAVERRRHDGRIALKGLRLVGQVEDVVASGKLPSTPATAFAPHHRVFDLYPLEGAVLVRPGLPGEEIAGLDIPPGISRIGAGEA